MKLQISILQYIKDCSKDCYDNGMLLLDKLCSKLGVKCFDADFDDDKVSGLLMKDKNSDTYSIYINRKHSATRKRFTAAHEIGHYISFLKDSYSKDELLKNNQLTDYSIIWRHSDVKSEAEQEANLIAAELLMPMETVKKFIKEGLTVEEMAETFFVSSAAMTIRLQCVNPDGMVIA